MVSTSKVLGTSELERLQVLFALKKVLRVNKKMVFRAMKSMKNGALWLCYAIDGVKCSTFAKQAALTADKRSALFSELFKDQVHTYVAACAKSFGLDAVIVDCYHALGHCKIKFNNPPHRDPYTSAPPNSLCISFDQNGRWTAYHSAKLDFSHFKADSLNDLLTRIVDQFVGF